MFRAFFCPLLILLILRLIPRVDSVATRFQHFLGHFRQQVLVPATQPGSALGAFRQAAAEKTSTWRQMTFAASSPGLVALLRPSDVARRNGH